MLGLGLAARTAAEIKRDIAAAQSRDPAARGVGSFEILATWPGVHARLLRPRYNPRGASARPLAYEQPPVRQCCGGVIDVPRPHQHETQAPH